MSNNISEILVQIGFDGTSTSDLIAETQDGAEIARVQSTGDFESDLAGLANLVGTVITSWS